MLRFELNTRVADKAAKPALAGLLAGLVLFAAILSSSPSLHEQFHQNSSSPSHACVVCLFAQGHLSVAEVGIVAVGMAAALSFFCKPISSAIFSSVDYRLSPSRAPPRG